MAVFLATSSSPSNDSCSWAARSTLIAWPFRRTRSAWTAHDSTSPVRLPPGVKFDATRLTHGFSILPADRVLRRRHAEHQASLKSLNHNVSMEDDDPGFWISKRWWRRFFEAVPPGALTDFAVPVPFSDEFQSGASSFWSGSWARLVQTGGFFLNIDVVCVHGGLQPTGSRRLITEEVRPCHPFLLLQREGGLTVMLHLALSQAFDFLKTIYGKFGLFDGGTPKCNICEEDAIPSKMKAAAERVRLNLSSIPSLHRANHRPLLSTL